MQNTPEHLGNGYFLVRTDNPVYHFAPIYRVKNADKVLMSINLGYPDSFALAWDSSQSADEFLKAACKLIDDLSKKPHHYRPTETGNPTAIRALPLENGTNSLRVNPSYSDFGYNNLMLLPLAGEIRFDQLSWPVNLQNIYKFYIEDGLGNQNLPKSDDEIFIRINGEFCTLFYGDADGLKWYPRRFSYWSHVPAAAELYDTHLATAISPIPEVIFSKVLEKTIAPRFPIE